MDDWIEVQPSPEQEQQDQQTPSLPDTMANPTPETHSMLHLIDDNLNLTTELQDYMVHKWQLGNIGMDYNLVAVFGAQSSGKSTLLNMLFQTNFDVMQGARKHQTTKGLWLSMGALPNTLVMDVEGTDGKERGEDLEMERKSAVFSLTTSQVLIINMFENDVGRFQGANYGLLKTVFDVNLQLFQAIGSPKTLLLFVIRDQTLIPLEGHVETLTTDLNKIWSELSKPKGFENSTLGDFFDLKFTSLPHKHFLYDKFVEDVNVLREWFSDKENPNYLFKPQYHKLIPADGFSKFVSDIWEKINHNRDLDLPTQRQLLAQFRCNEIATSAFEKVAAATKKQAADIENGMIIADLGKTFAQLRAVALEEYQAMAHRYDPAVFEKMATELREKIHSNLYPLYTGTVRNLFKRAVKTFAEDLSASLRAAKEPFSQIVAKLEEVAITGFVSAAEELTLSEAGWSFHSMLEELKEALEAEVVKKKDQEMKKALEAFKKSLQFSLLEPMGASLGEAKDTMWADIQVVVVRSVELADKFVTKFQQDFACTPAELEEQRAFVHGVILELLHQKVADEVAETTFYAKLRKRFETGFKYDEAHRPRIWKTLEEIPPIFDSAKAKAERFLNLFLRPDENLDLTILSPEADWGVLIPESKKSSLWDRLELEAGVMFQEAANSTANTFAKIPPWFYVVLLLLGWNELWAILTNPLYLFVTVIVGGGVFTMFSLHLEGPVLQAVNMISGEVVKLVQNKLAEASATASAQNADRRESLANMRRESQLNMRRASEGPGDGDEHMKMKTM